MEKIEEFLTKGAVYFSGVLVCLGLILNKDLIIKVGIVPLIILAMSWMFRSIRKMKQSTK